VGDGGATKYRRPDTHDLVTIDRPPILFVQCFQGIGDNVVGVVEVDPLGGASGPGTLVIASGQTYGLVEARVADHPQCDRAAQGVEERQGLAALQGSRKVRFGVLQVVEVIGGDHGSQAVGDDAQRCLGSAFGQFGQGIIRQRTGIADDE